MPLGGAGSIFGQVVAEWGVGHFYLVVFSRAYGQEETPSVEEILSDEIALIALVLDAKLWNREWPVIGWAPADADAVPFPAYLEGTDVVALDGETSSPGNKRRAAALAVSRRLLAGRGVDLGEPREVHHFLSFGTKGSAAKAQSALQARGFAVDVKRSGGDWLVTATNEARVTSELVADVRSSMERLAAALGGEYDGWEAAVSE